ncbi:MAG: phosphoribosylamine--glycine ligase [Bacteroidota bacterium]|nr:phosphoribosylamine--glycine ligase [Bacteroidota bacterium]
MKILLIGNGGREDAIARKIYNSKLFIENNGKLFNTIGSPGINRVAERVNIKPTNTNALVEFALRSEIDFTIVGPEIPLSLGIVNEFEKNGLRIFGPRKEAAEIESSKIFAKNLMQQNNIPTARYKIFSKESLKEAREFFDKCSYPVVIKADGLASGKGVLIARNLQEAEDTIKDFCGENSFGEAGYNFVVEEFLDGEEISVFVITDGENYVVLPFSQDHKKIEDGDQGNNTGGMGAVAPVKKLMNDNLEKKIKLKIIEPVLKALKNLNREFSGCLYCGLMIVDDEPFVIEFNCRFGDPETQAVLPLIKSDFLSLLLAASDPSKMELKNYSLNVNDSYSCCVVLASKGYPDKYEIDKEITGIDEAETDSEVFYSGTKESKDKSKVFSNGGRVLSVVGISKKSLQAAVKKTYENVDKINFENIYYRKDIGFKQLIVDS